MYAEVTSEQATGQIVSVRGFHLEEESPDDRMGVLTAMGLQGWRVVTTVAFDHLAYLVDTLFLQDDAGSPDSAEEIEELRTLIASTQPRFELS